MTSINFDTDAFNVEVPDDEIDFAAYQFLHQCDFECGALYWDSI